jgi:hypothetical protein
MKLPNFLIIGAAKAGTTSLYYYLQQHPQIYMSPVKEPRFFAPEFYTIYYNYANRGRGPQPAMRLEEYQQLFAEATDEIAIGEASPEYLYFSSTPIRIKQAIPDVKMIAILRDPAERAFSAFCYHVRDGLEKLSFEEALKAENRRMQERWRTGWFYIHTGFYYEQLKRYFEQFNRNQIKVILYDELLMDSELVCQDIFRFLDVDPQFRPDLSRQNISTIPKNQFLNLLLSNRNPVKMSIKPLLPKEIRQKIAKNIRDLNMVDKPLLSTDTRHSLIKIYREDILKLQDLIQKDLSSWLIP